MILRELEHQNAKMQRIKPKRIVVIFGILKRWKLIPACRAVAVWPSTNFTGKWVNYYANGQKFTEGQYKDGLRVGEFVTYYPDGLKNAVYHYKAGEEEGMRTVYYPSGRIQIQCLRSNHATIGTEVLYNEDGTTNRLIDHSTIEN